MQHNDKLNKETNNLIKIVLFCCKTFKEITADDRSTHQSYAVWALCILLLKTEPGRVSPLTVVWITHLNQTD